VRSYWALARPRGALCVAALPLLGYGFAHWDHAAGARGTAGAALVVAAWLALHAGTLWLNAALDRDAGEVLFGRSVPIPRRIAVAGYAALAAAVLLGVLCGAGVFVAAAAALAVCYSHPSVRWKGHPILGPLTNGLGYGVLSPAAGWAVAGLPATPRLVLALAVLASAALAVYFAAQAFQGGEDGRRGYRTPVVCWGARRVLGAARVSLGVAALGTAAPSIAGWLPLACAVVVAGWLAGDRWLAAWQGDGRGDERRARGFVGLVAAMGMLVLAAATADYLVDRAGDGEVAGRATRRGAP
jgi:hypothetical protein